MTSSVFGHIEPNEIHLDCSDIPFSILIVLNSILMFFY